MSYIAGVKLDNVRVSTEDPEFALGTVHRNYDGKQYKYVQFNDGAGNVASVSGGMAYYFAPAGVSAGATTTVTMDVTDSGGIGAGAFQAVITDGGYGWVQTQGSATLSSALTSGADGNSLSAVGATDGTLNVAGAVTDFVCAVAVDASAVLVMLTCPD